MIGPNSTTRPRRLENRLAMADNGVSKTIGFMWLIRAISAVEEETMRKSSAVIAALFLCSALLVPVNGQNVNQAANEPLTLQELNILLRREVGRNMTEADLAIRVERLGIAFDPTPDAVGRLRANGAHQNLINAVKRAADKFSASAGRVVVTGPQPSDPFIEETRKIVREYLDELPDFICQEDIQRYFDYDGSGAW